jgi:hypothetical protein
MRDHGFPTFPDPNAQRGFTDLPRDANPSSPSPQYITANKACQPLVGNGLQLSPAREAQIEASGLKFAECMRDHRVPNYPDPTYKFADGTVSSGSESPKKGGIDPNSPIFQAAQKACETARASGAS